MRYYYKSSDLQGLAEFVLAQTRIDCSISQVNDLSSQTFLVELAVDTEEELSQEEKERLDDFLSSVGYTYNPDGPTPRDQFYIRSPDGRKWRMVVDNDGVLSTEEVV